MGRELTSVGRGHWGDDVPLRGCGCRGCRCCGCLALFSRKMSLASVFAVDLVVVVVVGIQVRE